MTQPVAASVQIASVANSSMDFTAAAKGLTGNGASVAYVDDTTAGNETVSVSGLAATVHIEAANSTAAQVKTAWDASAAALAIATCANHSGHNGTGKPGAVAATPLTGGTDGFSDNLSSVATLANRRLAADAIRAGYADGDVSTVLTTARLARYKNHSINSSSVGGIASGVNS